MAHLPRFGPPGPNGEFLAEISQRCLLGFFLLRPSDRLNALIAGIIARAQEKYPVKVIALSFLSSHYHLIISSKDQELLSAFMNFVSSNTAREAGRLHGWKGKLWARRFDCVAITDEEKIQVARLKYVLAQGTKEGLVASPRHWPGLSTVRALLGGKNLKGIWVDRTALYRARQRKGGRRARPIDFEQEVTVRLSQIPCWAHLSPEDYRQRILELVQEIEKEAAALHAREGTRPAGRRAVLRQSPHYRPAKLKSSPRPLVHAGSRRERHRFLESYRLFVQAFRTASERFRSGDLGVAFPVGSFPPAATFVKTVARSG